METIRIANQFADRVWQYRDTFSIDNIMLYGSLARGAAKPKDIDLMIIHDGSGILEEMQGITSDESFSNNLKRYDYFLGLLKKVGLEGDVFESEDGIKRALSENFLNIQYLNKKFFSDDNFALQMISLNSDPNFYVNIFSDGLLWDPNEKLFLIRANERYGIKRIQFILHSLNI